MILVYNTSVRRVVIMKLVEFLIKAKTKTYADGIKSKVTSTKLNSIDYHYTEGKYIYHDTYFGSKEF